MRYLSGVRYFLFRGSPAEAANPYREFALAIASVCVLKLRCLIKLWVAQLNILVKDRLFLTLYSFRTRIYLAIQPPSTQITCP